MKPVDKNKHQPETWPTHLLRPLDLATRLAMYLSGVALFLILGVYILEVAMRYFLNSPTTWSNDVIQLFFAAMVMLASAEVTRQKGHIVITYFLEKVNPKRRRKLERGIALMGGIICFLAAYICLQESLRQYQHNIETLWNSPIPKWWISGLIPFGFLLTGLQWLQTFLVPKEW